MIGLGVGTMLARDGHHVIIFDADAAPAPTSAREAWDKWDRRGVAQFRQPHFLQTRFRHICDAELPGLSDRFLADGCIFVDHFDDGCLPPATVDRAPRAKDAALQLVTGRRPVTEAAMAAMAEAEPRLTLRRGVKIEELATEASALAGVPHVAGVRTNRGEIVEADLVIDATGRSSVAPSWIAMIGGRAPIEETEDGKFIYFTRYFTGPSMPRRLGLPQRSMGSFNILTLPGDNATWCVVFFTSTRNKAMGAVRAPEVFDRVVKACPRGCSCRYGFRRGGRCLRLHQSGGGTWPQHWHDPGSNSATCGAHLDDPTALVLTYDAETERLATPYYRNQVANDHHRLAEINAILEGKDPPPPNPTMARFLAAAMGDREVYRCLIEVITCLALPQEVMARPYVASKMHAPKGQALPPSFGMSHGELLGLLATK
jgi:hypothetical protein